MRRFTNILSRRVKARGHLLLKETSFLENFHCLHPSLQPLIMVPVKIDHPVPTAYHVLQQRKMSMVQNCISQKVINISFNVWLSRYSNSVNIHLKCKRMGENAKDYTGIRTSPTPEFLVRYSTIWAIWPPPIKPVCHNTPFSFNVLTPWIFIPCTFICQGRIM